MTRRKTARRRRVFREAPEVEAMMRRMFRGLVRRAAEGDTEALEALARLEDVAAAAMTVGLHRSHVDQGGRYTFGELCQVVGTSRQAVRQRVGRATALPADLASFLAMPPPIPEADPAPEVLQEGT